MAGNRVSSRRRWKATHVSTGRATLRGFETRDGWEDSEFEFFEKKMSDMV